MALISPEDQETLKKMFEEKLTGDVTITYFTQRESPLVVPGHHECAYCKETREILEEVTDLSDKLHLTVKDFVADEKEAEQMGVTRIPAYVMQGQNKGKVRFFGLPAGYEFSTLLQSIIDVSTGETQLSQKTKDALNKVEQELQVQVFVTPTWPYCPRAASLAVQMAVENEHIIADVVEVSEFVELAQRYNIQGVPKTVVNDSVEFVGALPEPRFLQQVLQAEQKKEQS